MTTLSSTSSKTTALAVLKPLFLLLGALGWVLLRLSGTRAGLLRYDRIGHLAGNTERLLRRRAAGKDSGKLVLFSGPPANHQLLSMIARRLTVLRSKPALWVYTHGLLPFLRGTPLHETLPYQSNEYGDFAAARPQLVFTEDEESRGQRLLRSLGVSPGAPFICFHARDRAYLDAALTHRSREEWSYQDHRDCAIESYLPAAEALAAKGIYALRMGSAVAKPVSPRDGKVIDYAVKCRSDFGDVYLPARCRFFLGNEAGLYNVAAVFGTPVALANLTPLGYAPLNPKDLFIFKLVREAKSGRLVPFREQIRLGADLWLHADKFRNAGLELVDNTAEEILALALEMEARLDGTWAPESNDEDLQDRFRAVFPKSHRIEGYPSRIGSDYLRRHKELLS